MIIGFKKTGKLYKGNTHLHTTLSDGKMTPEEAFDKYKKLGYSFVVLTDHIRYFNSKRYDTKDFIVIPGVEIHVEHDWENNRDHHLVGMYDPSKGETFPDGHVFEVPQVKPFALEEAQERIDLLKANANLAIYTHPIWSNIEPEDLITLKNYDLLEIWNHESVFWSDSGNGTFHWDYLLRNGCHMNGVASDDLHQKDDRCLGGYILVQAESLTNEAISKAMLEGNFYSSTGPEIDEFYIDEGTIFAKGSKCRNIAFITNSRNRKYWGENPGDTISSASHPLADDVTYVRVEFQDFEGNKAWSNPIYID